MKKRTGVGILLGMLISSAAFAGWHGRIFVVNDRNSHEINRAQLIEELKPVRLVVLGEKHNTVEVQKMQATLIAETMEVRGQDRPFVLGWEFLDFSDQPKIETEFARFASGEIDGMEFLRLTQGSDFNSSYLPILEEVKKRNSRLMGLNLSRKQKAPIVRGGLGAAEPGVIPPGFALGGPDYRERFEEAMGGHAPPSAIDRYYAAQCVTDDVMAYHLVQDAGPGDRFLVAGSFHVDYQDGTVARVRIRDPLLGLKTVKIIDSSDWNQPELEKNYLKLLADEKYGPVADYVVFVSEPH